MFDKEAEEIAKDIYIHHFDDDVNYPEVLKAITVGVQKGAELGYNKANEWYYVKDGDFPKGKTEKKYLVALKSEYTDIFYETDIWCESLHCFASNHPKNVIAWKEIVFPELKESE